MDGSGSPILIVDSREKWTQPNSTDNHIAHYLFCHNIDYTIRKLDCGDYQWENDPSVSVDRKKSLDELATNLLNKSDSCRFWREVRRAHAQGTKLIVLCECGSIQTIESLLRWKSKYSGVTGRRLLVEIQRCEYAYGVVFKFCDRRSTARVIIELLNEYGGGNKYAKTKTRDSTSGGDAC